jgi:hypothetical protein
MQSYDDAPRRRRWPLILLVLIVVAAGLWAGGWYFAAGKVEETMDGWKAREAKSGRVYSCASQSVSGFPFRIEVNCDNAAAELKSNQPPLALKAQGIVVSAQIWQPTVLVSEFTGPLSVGESGQPANFVANWRRAQTSVTGLPTSPERIAIALDDPTLDRATWNGSERVLQAEHMDLNGRMLEGSAQSNPVIEVTLALKSAAAPGLHPAAAIPLDADVVAVLRGLKDFAPKPWPARFRELQAANGRIQVTKARVQQGETIAIANGELGLSPSGRLNGELRVTVANLDKLLPRLGLDQMLAPQAAPNQLNNAFGALDRLMPGLGNVARRNAGPAIVAGVAMMGQPTELEGQKATTLPLRFNDGAVSLGPLPLGQVAPLF